MPGLKLPWGSDLLNQQFDVSLLSYSVLRLSHLLLHAFIPLARKSTRLLFSDRSRCTQPAILISLVWLDVYASCFEMLEKFQITLGKNISWFFFPWPSLLVQIFCEQVFSEKKYTYLTPLNASLNLLLIFLFLFQMLNLCLNHITIFWVQSI